MRKTYLILALFFTFLAMVFSFLPLDTIAFLPIGIAFLFSLLLLKKSIQSQKKLPKTLLFICGIITLFVVGKTVFVKDEIVEDTKFEKEKVAIKKEAQKELEEIENDLE